MATPQTRDLKGEVIDRLKESVAVKNTEKFNLNVAFLRSVLSFDSSLLSALSPFAKACLEPSTKRGGGIDWEALLDMLRNDDVRSSASPSQEEEGGESFDNKEGSGADKQEGKRSNKEEVGVSDKKEGGDSDKKEGRGSAKRADEDHEVIEISSSPVARTTRASTAVAATQSRVASTPTPQKPTKKVKENSRQQTVGANSTGIPHYPPGTVKETVSPVNDPPCGRCARIGNSCTRDQVDFTRGCVPCATDNIQCSRNEPHTSTMPPTQDQRNIALGIYDPPCGNCIKAKTDCKRSPDIGIAACTKCILTKSKCSYAGKRGPKPGVSARRKATPAATTQKKRKRRAAEPAEREDDWDDDEGEDYDVDDDETVAESGVSKRPRREAAAPAAQASSNPVPSSNLATSSHPAPSHPAASESAVSKRPRREAAAPAAQASSNPVASSNLATSSHPAPSNPAASSNPAPHFNRAEGNRVNPNTPTKELMVSTYTKSYVDGSDGTAFVGGSQSVESDAGTPASAAQVEASLAYGKTLETKLENYTKLAQRCEAQVLKLMNSEGTSADQEARNVSLSNAVSDLRVRVGDNEKLAEEYKAAAEAALDAAARELEASRRELQSAHNTINALRDEVRRVEVEGRELWKRNDDHLLALHQTFNGILRAPTKVLTKDVSTSTPSSPTPSKNSLDCNEYLNPSPFHETGALAHSHLAGMFDMSSARMLSTNAGEVLGDLPHLQPMELPEQQPQPKDSDVVDSQSTLHSNAGSSTDVEQKE